VQQETYLDFGSSTPLAPSAREAISRALDEFGDPLRIHARGRAARSLLEEERARVADAIGAQPDEIVLTSGGTESIALAISGGVRAARERDGRVVVSSVEHASVRGACDILEADGFEIATAPVDASGLLDIDAFAAEIRRPGTLLASVQHANQETGTLQPTAEAGRLCREAGVLFHTDACQTVGRLPLDVCSVEVDLLSLSGHKFGGPPGIGALFVRRGTTVAGYPCGDERERRRRSGMENLLGAAGMAAALSGALVELGDQAARQWALTDRLRSALEHIDAVRVFGHPTHRAPHLVCFTVSGVDAEVLMMALDDRGFRLSAGSNCSGAAAEPSPVLQAMGVSGAPSFRAAVGPTTTDQGIDRLLVVLPALIGELRRVDEASSQAMARFRSPAGE